MPQPPNPRGDAIARVAHRWAQHGVFDCEAAWDDLNMLVNWMEESGLFISSGWQPVEMASPGIKQLAEVVSERYRARQFRVRLAADGDQTIAFWVSKIDQQTKRGVVTEWMVVPSPAGHQKGRSKS